MRYFVSTLATLLFLGSVGYASAAPLFTNQRSILPETDSTYYLGSTTPDRQWAGIHVDEVCLNGSCRTTWPSGGGGGGTFPFSEDTNYGQLVYSTTTPTLWFRSGFFASSTSHLVNASTTRLSIGSDFITDINGTGLSLSAAGVLSASLGTAIDISDETNLAGTYPIVLTGDTLSLGFATTTLSGNSQVAVSNNPFVIGATPAVLSIVADSIGDSQLAFDTGQTLTTAGTPTFAGLTVTGLSGCVNATGGVLGSTGSACGAGGGSSYPFTPTANFGVTMSATSTPIWGQAGLYASSTSVIGTTTFASNGSVGVGSTTPWGKLSVNTSGLLAAPAFAIGSSTGGTNFVVSNSGRVGVGTSTPMGAFSVVGDEHHYGSYYHFGNAVTSSICVANPCIELDGSDNTVNGTGFLTQNNNRGASAYTGYTLANDINDTATANFAGMYLNSSVYNDATFGEIVNVPYLYQIQNAMGPLQLLTSTTSVANNYIQFATGGVARANERMRITSDGTVGVASTSPSARFSIHAAHGATDQTLFAIGSSTASATTTHFTVKNTGDVGVGTTTPTKKFSVNGEIFNNATTTTAGLNVLAPTVGTSTQYIYSKTATFGGQVILEDVDGAGCTAITALNGTVSGVTVTCPTEL